MMKNCFLVGVVLVAVIACPNPLTKPTDPSARSITVSWHVAGSPGRTILPTSFPTPSTYDVLLHPASGSDVSQTGLTTNSWTFDNLSAAVYTITVTGKDSGGNAIVTGSGSADLTSVAVQNPAITLNYISTGSGTGQIHLSFDASSAGVTVSATAFTLVGPTGAIVVNAGSLSGSSPTFTYSNTSATVGSYTMFTKFTGSGKVAMKNDTIIVLQGVDTAKTVTLASADFSDSYVAVTGLSLSAHTMGLTLGPTTGGLVATLAPANASNTLVTWSSSDPSVATVDQSGVVTSAAMGAVSITATSVDNPLAHDSCSVTVSGTITYDPNGATTGNAFVDLITYAFGQAVTVLDNIGGFAQADHAFNGWNTSATYGGANYQALSTFPMPSTNVTLYAQWLATPTGLAASSPTRTSLGVSWNASGGATGPTTYQLYRATSAAGPWTNEVYNGTATSCTDTGLTPGTTYYYEVQATSPSGSTSLSGAASGATYYGYLYVTNEYANNISAFGIRADGVLTALSGSPFAAGGTAPQGIAISPDGSYLYVACTSMSKLYAFKVGSDGALSVSGSFSTGAWPIGVAISPNGSYLYATNYQGASVSAFSIGAGGVLTALSGSPFATGGTSPQGIAVSPNGSYLYAVNNGSNNVAAFSIGAGGTLTQASGSPFAAGSSARWVSITPNSSFAYVTNQSGNSVSAYSIGTGGALTSMGSKPAGSWPYNGMATSPNGSYLYVANNGSSNISAFSIGSGGALTALSGSPFASGDTSPQGLAISPNGNHLFVVNSGSGTVSGFSIGGNGALSVVGSQATGSGPWGIAILGSP